MNIRRLLQPTRRRVDDHLSAPPPVQIPPTRSIRMATSEYGTASYTFCTREAFEFILETGSRAQPHGKHRYHRTTPLAAARVQSLYASPSPIPRESARLVSLDRQTNLLTELYLRADCYAHRIVPPIHCCTDALSGAACQGRIIHVTTTPDHADRGQLFQVLFAVRNETNAHRFCFQAIAAELMILHHDLALGSSAGAQIDVELGDSLPDERADTSCQAPETPEGTSVPADKDAQPHEARVGKVDNLSTTVPTL